MTSKLPEWFVIDTDAGVDDAVALIMACRDMPRRTSMSRADSKSDALDRDDMLQIPSRHKIEHELKLIITCHGNTSEENVFINCQKILWAASLTTSVPLARGATSPLTTASEDASYFHGKDGLGDVCNTALGYAADKCLETNNSDDRMTTGSRPGLNAGLEALLQLLLQADAAYKQALDAHRIHAEDGASAPVPVKITLVTLGPLTNLALLVQWLSQPENASNLHLLGLIQNIVIMGGSANGRGNVTRTAEFNINADPEAAQIVFAFPWDQIAYNTEIVAYTPHITVVSWDLCKEYSLPYPFFDQILRIDHRRELRPPVAHSNQSVEHFAECLDCKAYHDLLTGDGLTRLELFLRSVCWCPFVQQREADEQENCKRGGNGAVICDCLAVAIAMNPQALVIESNKVHVDVELQGMYTRGQTVVDFGHCYDGQLRNRNIEWITKISVAAYQDSWSRMMNPSHRQPLENTI